MMIRVVLRSFLLIVTLAGCSDTPQKADKEFREAYEKNFVPSCVSSAMQNGVAEEKARQKCTCLARYMTEHYSPAELSRFASGESPETKKMFDAAFAACK